MISYHLSIDKYLMEKKDDLKSIFQKGKHNLLVSSTGTGKTSLALEIAKESNYTVLLSPTRVIVDQITTTAEQLGLTLVEKAEIDDWAFGELQIKGGGKIWIGTFAAARRRPPKWELCDFIFIDELHFLMDLSIFGAETAAPIWHLISNTHKYPNTTFVSLTASTELIMPTISLFNIKNYIEVFSHQWTVQPEEIIIYPTVKNMTTSEYIMNYIKYSVKNGEKVLCVCKSYQEMEQLEQYIEYMKDEVEIINTYEKIKSEVYWEICFYSKYPKKVSVFIATSWISLGASIYDTSIKHIVTTFPNYSIVHQTLSRIRTGGTKVVVLQLTGVEESIDNSIPTLVKQSETKRNRSFSNPEWFIEEGGEKIFFPLPILSETYQKQQRNLFRNLSDLASYLESNLNARVKIMWEELLQYRNSSLSEADFKTFQKLCLRLNFPVFGARRLKNLFKIRIQ